MTVLKFKCDGCGKVFRGRWRYSDLSSEMLCRRCQLENELRYFKERHTGILTWLKSTHIKQLKEIKKQIKELEEEINGM